MFTLKLPHRLISPSNRVFSAGLKQIRFLSTHRNLVRYTILVILVPLSILAIWWLLTVLTYSGAQKVQRWELYTSFKNIEIVLGIILLIATPVAALTLDLYSVGVAMTAIDRDLKSGLTDYVAAKYAVAQIKAWRALVPEMAVRLSSVCLLFMAFTFTDNCFIGDKPPLSTTCGVSFWPLHMELSVVILLCAAVIPGMLFILEPLWRMRTLTAGGLLISARVRKPVLAWLAAFASIVGVHFVQLALLFLVFVFIQSRHNVIIVAGAAIIALALFILAFRTAHNRALAAFSQVISQP